MNLQSGSSYTFRLVEITYHETVLGHALTHGPD